jgi:hypothetical protein
MHHIFNEIAKTQGEHAGGKKLEKGNLVDASEEKRIKKLRWTSI